nr:anthranilate synthase component I [Oceanococcus sp. HetDA_MAG_MS8]
MQQLQLHTRSVLSDLETPLTVYLKLAAGPNSFLLESVQGGETWGRYSIIGLPAKERLEVRGNTVSRVVDGHLAECLDVADPLQWIADYAANIDAPELPELPRLNGGLVGYFGAATIGHIEPRVQAAMRSPEDPLDLPDICLLRADEFVIFDNLRNRLHLVVLADASVPAAEAQQRLEALQNRLEQPLAQSWPVLAEAAPGTDLDFEASYPQAAYEAGVQRIRDYILAGDCMQVVLSQRLTAPFDGSALNLYRALRSDNPSPYLYFFDYGDFQVAGSSPEVLVRLEHDQVTVRPIAGTRPRGATAAADKAFEEDLLADPKEVAEHLMLIDLGRNDVGRIAQAGSVQLTEKMVIERYSQVMHIVSNVVGTLADDRSAMDVLRATFPAGTLSGAPKVRALEIIAELEPHQRGLYSGAVGYLAWNGSMDTAIAIRTAVIKDGQVVVQAGAGIVADSVPAKEWEETMNKARAVLRAAARAAIPAS